MTTYTTRALIGGTPFKLTVETDGQYADFWDAYYHTDLKAVTDLDDASCDSVRRFLEQQRKNKGIGMSYDSAQLFLEILSK